MTEQLINYSQCWEDPALLAKAFSITKNDRVLSITSGGDNTLALVLGGAGEVVSLDLNPAQNYLLELKRAAARCLTYDEYLAFLGVQSSEDRTLLFNKVQNGLSPAAALWWSKHPRLISDGVIHAGRFERFTARFARYILPRIHSKEEIATLLACRTVSAQRDFYRHIWNSKRWRFFFSLASSRQFLKRFARAREMVAYAPYKNVAETYRRRLERHLESVSIQGNFFLHYSLTGTYGTALPPYLEEEGYTRLRHAPLSTLTIVSSDLVRYLETVPDGSFSKFNLSDVFEALSPETAAVVWKEIVRTAADGAVVVYWTNLVERTYPSALSSCIMNDGVRTALLRAKDRVFFYDGVHVHTIRK